MRFAEQERFKDGINPRKYIKKSDQKRKKCKTFTKDDFRWDAKNQCYICKNGKVLKRKAEAHRMRNIVYDMYWAKESDCSVCPLRLKCLSTPQTKIRYLLIPLDRPPGEKRKADLLQQMKAKIDTPEGRNIYSKRLAIVEPVFANIRARKRLVALPCELKQRSMCSGCCLHWFTILRK